MNVHRVFNKYLSNKQDIVQPATSNYPVKAYFVIITALLLAQLCNSKTTLIMSIYLLLSLCSVQPWRERLRNCPVQWRLRDLSFISLFSRTTHNPWSAITTMRTTTDLESCGQRAPSLRNLVCFYVSVFIYYQWLLLLVTLTFVLSQCV